MDYKTLQIFLPAFMIVFFGVVSLWSHLRKRKRVRFSKDYQNRITPEVKLVDTFFKVLLLLSIAVALVYAYFPDYYYVTGPIVWLDIPLVNTIGVLVLKCSLIWIVMAQFNIERSIALINSGVEQASFNKLLNYSQKLILTGFLIMFLGLFITISSVVAILIFLAAVVLFDRLQKILQG
jgi:hypothetical protein